MSATAGGGKSATRPIVPRWVFFGVALASLVLLTYAGVLLSFSILVTEEIASVNPELVAGTRAIIVPLGGFSAVQTLDQNETPTLLVHSAGRTRLPSNAVEPRFGRALLHVAEASNGTAEVGNRTIDLAALSGGAEGWVLQGSDDEAPWFSAKDRTVGAYARPLAPALLTGLLAVGAIGFLAPLVGIVLTHKGGQRAGAPQLFCRECRAPMPGTSDFCMRCGAYSRSEEPPR